MENLGPLSSEAVRGLKEAKLLILVRPDGNVWVDPSDLGKAKEIMGKFKKSEEQIYRFHGFTIRMPKDIRIEQKLYGCASQPVGRRGAIHIHELAKPSNGLDANERTKQLKSLKVNGKEIKMDCAVFSPAYCGIVMCDDEGTPVFEVMPYNVYTLFDVRANGTATRDVYEPLLMYAIVLANHADAKSAQVWQEIWDKQASDREKLEMRQFEEVVTGGLKRELDQLRQSISGHQQQIQNYENAIFKEVRSLQDEQFRLDAFQGNMKEGIEKRAKEEWQKIKVLERNKAVRNIRITKDNLSFITRKILWTPPRGGYRSMKPDGTEELLIDWPVELGEFEVTIKMGMGFEVHVSNLTKNLTHEASTWHHPHIRDGSVCKGNMAETLPKFAAQRDFEALMMCMLKWLENVDVKDAWGKTVFYWAKDDLKRKAKEKEEAERKAAEEAAKAAPPKTEGGAPKVGEAAPPPGPVAGNVPTPAVPAQETVPTPPPGPVAVTVQRVEVTPGGPGVPPVMTVQLVPRL